jgi:predicted transcriptional regulator/transcriptional regulator with XRE-family HTH domain
VRALRRQQGLRQTKLAAMLGVSASYLNLIEHDRRPLSAELLLKLAKLFELDLATFSGDSDARLASDLLEVFGDPVFDEKRLDAAEVRELAATSASVARSVVHLYQLYREARDAALARQDGLARPGEGAIDYSRLPAEEVTELIQARRNHFPELEEAADGLWRMADLRPDDMYHGLSRHLRDSHGVEVRYVAASADGGAFRRFEPGAKRLVLSESLPRPSRKFQIAHQIGLIAHADALDAITAGAGLSTGESRALCRVALANYFAGAVVMPYDRFLDAARETRHDLDLLCNRFGASFEQVCHRLTTLRRPGREGIPFHFVRTDIAGNISKRFSGSGIPISRFGACPRWNLHAAFLTPGNISVQLSRMPDDTCYFSIARTVAKGPRGHRGPRTIQAVTLGCEVRYAPAIVYADGVDLDHLDAAVPIGTTCRVCERNDCEQRAFPRLRQPLQIDENVRGVSFWASPPGRGAS